MKQISRLGWDIRPPAAAGIFYPENPQELREAIEALLLAVPAPPQPTPKAIIAPHAGYVFSGPVAASAYRSWLGASDVIERVVLVGPSHYQDFAGLGVSSAKAFGTPLGLVPVDREWQDRLRGFSCVSARDAAHGPEHALEVHLPFLQVVLHQFTLVPLLAGEIGAEELSEVLDKLWGGEETRVVISSDLSHYLDWPEAKRVDRATAQAIESFEAGRIDAEQACGCIPIRGLLRAALRHRLSARTLDLRNSGDITGLRTKVVGYGAFAFAESG